MKIKLNSGRVIDLNPNEHSYIEVSRKELIEINNKDYEILENKLWKPKPGQKYFIIDYEGDVLDCHNNNQEKTSRCYDLGNCYQTREQAQAVVDLKKHIYKFDMPQVGENYYYVNKDCEFYYIDVPWDGEYFGDPACYHSGMYITKDSTEEDRQERSRLLKLAYGKY